MDVMPLSSANGRLYWLGLNDHATEGRFVWENTGREMTLSFFADGEPNNLGDEDCTHTGPGIHWWDNTCTRLFSFICESEILGCNLH